MRGSAVIESRDVPFGFHTIDKLYIRAKRSRARRKEKSEISCCLKYYIFSINFIFNAIGCLLIAVGIWAWHEKEVFKSLHQIQKLAYDPAMIVLVFGMVVSIISFSGCTGALRENTFLLTLCTCLIGLTFCSEVVLAMLAFFYKDAMIEQIKFRLQHVILDYRENVDLRDLIDWIQGEWLKCCGIESIDDWQKNMYFNCSSPSAERCGVPPSCCKLENTVQIRDFLCGRNLRHKSRAASRDKFVYTMGCVHAAEQWLEKNLISVCVTFAIIAVVQIFSICIVQNLRSDIVSQRNRWRRRLPGPTHV